MQDQLKAQIRHNLNFEEGMLPITYLGIPLVSTAIKKNHCTPFIDKITAKVNNWATKHLSYAGRVQLINSVMRRLHVYWCSVFVIPKAVVKEIDRRYRRFLWTGTVERDKKRSSSMGHYMYTQKGRGV